MGTFQDGKGTPLAQTLHTIDSRIAMFLSNWDHYGVHSGSIHTEEAAIAMLCNSNIKSRPITDLHEARHTFLLDLQSTGSGEKSSQISQPSSLRHSPPP